jgi:hypothetical protein
MRVSTIPAAVALLIVTGCATAPPLSAGPFQVKQYGTGGLDSRFATYAPQINMVATGPAAYVTPRGVLSNVPGHRRQLEIVGLQIQGQRIQLLTRSGQTLIGYTHSHGPDVGFAIDLGGGDTLEGIVHTSTGARHVTLALVAGNRRVFSGRQEFQPAPIPLQGAGPAPIAYQAPTPGIGY